MQAIHSLYFKACDSSDSLATESSLSCLEYNSEDKSNRSYLHYPDPAGWLEYGTSITVGVVLLNRANG
jgi:hypothetical protein